MPHRLLSFMLVFLCLPSAVRAAEVARLLYCEEAGALLGDWPGLVKTVGHDATCSEHHYPSGSELECRTATAFSAYGIPAQEFILRETEDGTRELRGVFKAGADALRAAAQRHHHGMFEPTGANGWTLTLDARRSLRVDLREDGACELTCSTRGKAADDARRAGADAEHGAIAGRLAFPTAPIPAMRVCAVPADAAQGRRYCMLTAEGSWSYLLGGVPPGGYVVVAIARGANPNHYLMAHASGLSDCAPHQPGCAGALLQRVYLHAGEVLRGVDALQAFTDLPAGYEGVAE